MNEYFKFDYFSTSLSDMWVHKCNPEEYGLTISEVEDYIYQMKEDRRLWDEKRKELDQWGPLLQLFVSLSAVFIYALLCVIFSEIFKENRSVCFILASIFIFLLIGYEIHIWKNSSILNKYNRWMERKYKKRTQYNPVIEKLLDDANFEHWKCSQGLQRTSNE